MIRWLLFISIVLLSNTCTGYGKVAEFYIGFFRGRIRAPCLVLIATETSLNYSVEALGYYENGTILPNSRVIVNLPWSVIVSSYNDQDNGVYLKTTSDKVTVIGQNAHQVRTRRITRFLDTFIVNEITDLCISEYEYYAVSVNSSYYYYNSSVLIVGTSNDTLLKLTVTQPVTTRIGVANATTLIPGIEYSFMINRLQTVYLSSTNDLTGTRIVTNKPVSVFSGHGYTGIPWNTYSRSYLIEQMPPTALWGTEYYVIPFANKHSGYAVKILAASECIINMHCTNFTNFNNTSVSLKSGGSVFEMFLSNETCAVWSVSKILVVQFSLGYPYSNGPMMTLVPPSVHYLSKIIFSVFLSDVDYRYDDDWLTHYINIIVLSQYYQPEMIYLVTGGANKSLDTQEWIPIKVNNITKAYGIMINISSVGISKIIHANEAALMSVIVYGFAENGGYGTTANDFSSTLGYEKVAQFYIGFFRGRSYDPCLVLVATETLVDFFVEAPGVGYCERGTILANSRVIVNLPRRVIVSSYNDQNKGIYLKTSSDKVTVIGQSTKGRFWRFTAWDIETFTFNEVIDLCTRQYKYFVISMNSSDYYYYNSSVLIVGTRNDTSLKLTVTQPVTTRIGDANATTLIPGREYSFMINRLQTVYLSSTYDLTGTRIITDKPVSVFSGHGLTGIPMHAYPYSYLIEQMPPVTLWGNVYYVIPFANRYSGYAVKVLAASECVVNIHFNNSTDLIFPLRSGESLYKVFLKNESCTVHSVSQILVVQFSLGYQFHVGPLMTLVSSPIHYLSKIVFPTVFSDYKYRKYDNDQLGNHYFNVIVLAQYYQPDMIYLVTGGMNKSLDTHKWIPIKVNNITKAYATTINNVSLDAGMAEIVHANKAALMSVIVYGFPQYGGYGTTANPFSSEIRNFRNQTVDLLVNNYILTLHCGSASIYRESCPYKWMRDNKIVYPGHNYSTVKSSLVIANLTVADAGHYQCTVFNNVQRRIATTTIQLILKVPAPRIITHPTDQFAAAPFCGVFICSASGYGTLLLSWIRKDLTVWQTKQLPVKANISLESTSEVTTSTLVIPNVTTNDVGRYYCVVWGDNKASRSHIAKLLLSEKFIPPTVKMPQSKVYLKNNNYTMSMNCIPHEKSFKYLWEKKNSILPPRAQGVYSSELTILNLRPEDSGEYRCIMSNATGRVTSSYSKLIIIISPPEVLTHPTSSRVAFYSNVQFKCVARGYGLVSIVWKKTGSQRLPFTARVTNTTDVNEITSVLTITEVIGYYSGQYLCEAKNIAGITTSSPATLHINVRYPEIIHLPENTTVLPQSAANFTCLAFSQSGLIYDWKMWDRHNLPRFASISYDKVQFSSLGGHFTIVSRLVISNVQPSNEGWYCCLATNECGMVKECAWLEVNTRPIITAQPTSDTLRVGYEGTALWCSANGTGSISYHWEKYHSSNDSWINPSHRVVNSTSPKMKFDKISEEDEGIYHCIVTNDDGSVVSDNATITVYGPPVIHFISPHTVVSEGKEVKLSCIVTNDKDAEDPVHIQWLNPSGEKIQTNGTYLLVHNTNNTVSGQLQSVLSFSSVSRSDGGEYACQAFNHIKSHSELKTRFTVEYPPVVTINPSQSPHVVSVGTMLLLYCEAHGQPTPVVQWYSGATVLNYVAQQFHQSYRVPTDVPHSTVYTCVVTNNADDATHTMRKNIQIIVQKLCPPLSGPRNGRVYIIDDRQTALFVCNSGYTIMGNTHASCVDGTWNSSSPVCNP